MKLFNDLKIKFEQANWASSPEFALFDSILEQHPELIELLATDITMGCKRSKFGRKDTPTVEQIVRAAIYKEIKKLDYRELEFHQEDSRICEKFLKLEDRDPFSFQTFQEYISKITPDKLKELLVALNKIAINEGMEDVSQIRQDTTVISTNIHYPTNNTLVWDCIKESHRLLSHLAEEINTLNYIDYTVSAKKTFFKINNTKHPDKRIELFRKQLITFTKCINQVANIVKKNFDSIVADGIKEMLQDFLPVMNKIYNMTYRKEIKGESVPNNDKLFSIYEQHTDIIVKGSRDVYFGHKVSLAGGKSNLVLDCDILRGNPADPIFFQPTIERIQTNYKKTPNSSVTDGSYACTGNVEFAKKKGIVNIVFNKVVGSLKSIASSRNMETRLKKWRSGIEAVISNIKRGFNMFVCKWKGWEHFQAKVLWSVIAYNIRVMTGHVLCKLSV
jgi:IS5 family transposase